MAERIAPVMLNQLARYAPALALVEARAAEESTLLEVGSGSEGIARFASPRWAITVSDRDFTDYGSVEVPADGRRGLERVQADVTELPFGDRSFDVVLALDLMEHLPPALRRAALSELARVSARCLIVGCPCGERALRSDARLARFYRLQGRRPPPWLDEHLENGFPEVSDIVDALRPFGEVDSFPNERIGPHELVSMLEGIRGVARATVWLASRLERGIYPGEERAGFARATLRAFRGGDREPAYRRFAVLERATVDQR